MTRMPEVVIVKKKPKLTGLALLREEFAEWKARKVKELVLINDKNN